MSDNAEVVFGVFDAIERRDLEAFASLCHPDVEFHEPESLPYGGTLSGESAFGGEGTWLGSWGPLQPGEEERRMDPRVVGESGDRVVVHYHQRGVDPQGRRIDDQVVGIYEIRDSKLARAQMFHFDSAALSHFLAEAAQT